jgi:ABC-type Fe3+ transport system permease subunit
MSRSRRRAVLGTVLVVALVVGLFAGVWGRPVAADGSDDPTVEDAREHRQTVSRLAAVAGRTLQLAGGGLAVGLGLGLCIGGVSAYGYWTRRFGS